MARKRKNTKAILNVARNIKKYRLLNGFTIEQLSHEAGVERKAIHNYEHGLVDTNITTLYLLAEALGIEAYELLLPNVE